LIEDFKVHLAMKDWSRLFQTCLLRAVTIALLINAHSAQAESVGLDSTGLTEKGLSQYQAGEYSAAIESWRGALKQTQDVKQQTILLENLARTYQKVGQFQPEIEAWNQLIVLHQQTQNTAALARILTEKAQALSRQGQSQNAKILLCDHQSESQCSVKSAIGLARKIGDRSTEAASLGSLGEVHRLQGNYPQAVQVLQLALNLATELENPTFQAAANNSLGNTYSHQAATRYRKALAFAVQDPTAAKKLEMEGRESDRRSLQHYQSSIALLNPTIDRAAYLQALTNMIPIYQRLEDQNQAQRAWEEAQNLLKQLPPSRLTAYGAIDLARLLQSKSSMFATSKARCGEASQNRAVEALLQQGQSIAMTIGDQRASAFALGALGNLAECEGKWDQALRYSERAILASGQSLADRDSLYLWEWQRGRVLREKGDPIGALVAYERSVEVLEQLRQEMVSANRDAQFDFRDTIDPIYRELVDLRLSQEAVISGPIARATKSNEKVKPKTTIQAQASNLQSTLTTLDALKLAELQNYFGNNCVIAYAKDRIDKRVQTGAAVLTTVVGEERTAVIISLPNGERKFNWIPVKRSDLEKTIEAYRIGLESFDTAAQGYDPKLAQTLYGWLVKPFEADLVGIETLVFVQDGLLRTVPMAALHDGKQFLIEKVAIATAPSLSLVDAKPFDRPNLNILALGLTQEATIGTSYFKALTQVRGELEGITRSVPRTTTLLDDDFNRKRLTIALQNASYSVVHIATHGKFGIDAEDTFFVMGDKADQKFNLNELDQLIRRVSKNQEPLDLLVLTACETAIGDDRSALGLAGVAVQAGASTAIASLWAVNDETTAQLSTSLYAQLVNPNMNKAQSLQAAQIKMITTGGVTAHPYYWSAFVLVGNWL
jgi:CHAT domain-containing protein